MLAAKRIIGKNTVVIVRFGVRKKPNSYISAREKWKKLILTM